MKCPYCGKPLDDCRCLELAEETQVYDPPQTQPGVTTKLGYNFYDLR